MEPSRSRITAEQRRLMIEFIKANPEIITGRFAGPDGARHKAKVLAQMANTLNSTGYGAVKTPEKWLRSFQDWKSDVKKKAAKIASHARGTGGGPPMPGLSDVERDLVDLIGETAVSGHAEVVDPLEDPTISGSNLPKEPAPAPAASEAAASPEQPKYPGSTAAPQLCVEEQQKEGKRKKKDEDFDDRMVEAMERQAEAYEEIAKQIGRLADAVGNIFLTINQPNTL